MPWHVEVILDLTGFVTLASIFTDFGKYEEDIRVYLDSSRIHIRKNRANKTSMKVLYDLHISLEN